MTTRNAPAISARLNLFSDTFAIVCVFGRGCPCPALFIVYVADLKVGDLNACASQLDHGFIMTDSEFYASNWSKWIRGMLGLDSPEPPRLVPPQSALALVLVLA